jgi:hypothetical protein
MTAAAAPELLPCPFCDGTPAICHGLGEDWVVCSLCGASTRMLSNREMAIAAWNRRAALGRDAK